MTPNLGAQARPALSGTWTYQQGAAPAALPAAPSGVLGARFALQVDGSAVVVKRVVRERTVATRLPLDASRTTTRMPGRLCEGEAQLHETAAWEGDALAFAVVGQTPAGGGEPRAASTRRLLRLEGPDRLVVEGTMMQGGQPKQVGSVYVRSNDPMPAEEATPSGPAATIGQLAWLGTTWVGTTGQVTTEERWTPSASGGMMAVARTLRGTALASFEFLCIVERAGTLVYVAIPEGRSTPTFFTLTGITDGSAVFENPTHDYPKMIRYTRSADGTTLETMIAGANGARPQTVSLKRAP
ncbi:MAG: hypothetical protein JNJ98_09675 [Gemmatimonadetes bacterium]|nr:hypothetical protein [Gemmatimonadota bacterium]